MATGGLYGQSSAGIVSPQSGSESSGLYGNNTVFGGTYFEWFIFQVADTQPATPTGGSWSFTTNSGTPPSGWLGSPPANPTNTVWVSVGLVNSKSSSAIEWSSPGKFSFASGLPILSGASEPTSGDGQSDQLYIQTNTAPETIWFKQAGTWTRLTGPSLYVDLTSNQTIAGTKTFSSEIQGSISGNAANVTGIVDITHGGTGSTTASAARTALGLGTAATQNSNAFATAAQGAKADSAVQTIASADGSVTVTGTTAIDLSVAISGATTNVLVEVRNTTGATLTKGTVVYITGATGQLPTVTKAIATTDGTSAQTLGMITANLANNSNGYVTVIGLITNIDTSAYLDGAQLYLSGTTAGGVTTTKPYAPIHLVYVGVVEYSHPTQGKIFVKVQNGYELDELHNVSAQTPSNGQTIVYNSSTSLWENNTVSLTAGVNGTLPIANGGTGQTTANAAFNALVPSQTGNNGKYLTTDGSNTSWATNPLGTVTSVNASGGTTGLTFSGGPITTSGTLTLAGTLAVANGGTGITSFGTGVATALGTNVGTAGSFVVNGGALGTPSSGTVTNLTGTASININGTVGATTPTTGAFTTLSASSTVTLSGGTANGVAYLNGSKVLTTGSSLVFDGTNLGLGVSPSTKLDIGSGTLRIKNATGDTSGLLIYQDTGDSSTFKNYYTGPFKWIQGSTQAMTLDASGKLGIGTTTPQNYLHVQDGGASASGTIRLGDSTYYGTIQQDAAVTGAMIYTIASASGGGHIWKRGSTENMRIDSSGNLLVGATSGGSFTPRMRVVAPGSQYGAEIQSNTVGYYASLITNTATSGDNYFVYFGTEANGGTQRGSITFNRAGGLTVYSTTSDYRAKDIYGPVVDSGAVIDSTPVYMGKMKGATQERPMFIAHETPSYAHTGEKDAVDEQGNPVYQAMDASALVPVLWAEVQSLRKRLAAAGIA